MNKLEFGDINKFLSSLGLISIGLAFLLPWFVSQNNSIVLIEKSNIYKLTPTAQKIILKQQQELFEINNYILNVSIFLITLGVILLIIGIFRWWNRQNVLDEIQNEELKSKKFQNISDEEKRKIIKSEIIVSNEQLIDSNHEETENKEDIDVNDKINKYIKIENEIYIQLSQKFQTNFIPNKNVRINNIEYDIIFKSINNTTHKDRIIEVKYFSNHLNYENIKVYIDKLINSTIQYEKLFRRKSMSIFFVIYAQNEFDESIAKYKKDIEEYSKKVDRILKVIFLKETDILNRKEILLK